MTVTTNYPLAHAANNPYHEGLSLPVPPTTHPLLVLPPAVQDDRAQAAPRRPASPSLRTSSTKPPAPASHPRNDYPLTQAQVKTIEALKDCSWRISWCSNAPWLGAVFAPIAAFIGLVLGLNALHLLKRSLSFGDVAGLASMACPSFALAAACFSVPLFTKTEKHIEKCGLGEFYKKLKSGEIGRTSDDPKFIIQKYIKNAVVHPNGSHYMRAHVRDWIGICYWDGATEDAYGKLNEEAQRPHQPTV